MAGIKDYLGRKLGDFISPYITKGSVDMYDLTRTIRSKEYLLTEKYVWYLGDVEILADFYQYNIDESTVINVREEYFYSNASQGIRAVHSGLPALISGTMARLLFSDGVFATTDRKTDQKTLDAILEENKMEELNKKGAITESWAGKFAYKLCFDKEVSDYPIVQIYDPRNFEEIKVMGRTKEIHFKEIIEKGKKKYLFLEKYGYGYIKYELYEIKKVKNEDELLRVDLSALEETKDFEDLLFPKDDDVILAMVKTKNSINGKSDYEGLISEFDAYDEGWSSFAEEIRNGKALTYIPENKIRYVDGKPADYDRFKKRFIKVASDMTEDGANKIEFDQPNIRSKEYEQMLNVVRDNILNAVGLSAVTIGIDDTANESGVSRREKEKASIRTREEMTNAWQPFLETFYELLLRANDIFNENAKRTYKVTVEFGDYITPTFDEKVKSVTPLVQNSIYDIEQALDYIHDGQIPEEIKVRILNNVGEMTFEAEEV